MARWTRALPCAILFVLVLSSGAQAVGVPNRLYACVAKADGRHRSTVATLQTENAALSISVTNARPAQPRPRRIVERPQRHQWGDPRRHRDRPRRDRYAQPVAGPSPDARV